MQDKEQFRNLLLNIIPRAATAALAIAFVVALTVALTQSAQAQSPAAGGGWTERVLHNFGNGLDGSEPYAGLIFDAAGNLYGTTIKGGAFNNAGTVFELTPTAGGGWKEKAVFSFNNTDGSWPQSSLIFGGAGNLYSTTYYGGSYGYGTVFELTLGPNTAGGRGNEKVLHNFNWNNRGGHNPWAGLILDAAGNLYGTASIGGTDRGGAVFELTPSPNAAGGGWTEQTLYSFAYHGTDWSEPLAGLIFDAAGNLYGTTYGGGTYDLGTVFELTPTTGGRWTEQVLHNFGSGLDGSEPYAGLIFDAAGNLCGTTFGGGTYGRGTMFEMTPTVGGGWTEQTLYSFAYNGTDGSGPLASLIFDAAGNLYGTTQVGRHSRPRDGVRVDAHNGRWLDGAGAA